MTWDSAKLARLRSRYAEAAPGTTHDPAFARIAERIFRGGTRVAPYAGLPTLLSAPPGAVDDAALADLQVALSSARDAAERIGKLKRNTWSTAPLGAVESAQHWAQFYEQYEQRRLAGQ